jgi:hypothetical protein
MAAKKRQAKRRPKSGLKRRASAPKTRQKPKGRKPARRQAAPKARKARTKRPKARSAAKRKPGRTAHARPVRKAKPTAKPRPKPAARPKLTAASAGAKKARRQTTTTPARPARKTSGASDRPRAEPPSTLGRSRRTLPDDERLEETRTPGGLPDDKMIRAARTGHDELQQSLKAHTATSPALSGGDVDAKWEDAYAVGDEAPGGDNPTPDQDRVEEIAGALGITYADDEELQGGEELAERDRARWELAPASADEWGGSDNAPSDDEDDK